MGQSSSQVIGANCSGSCRENATNGLAFTIATVMFTDVEDSTGLAKALGITGIAAFLKEHLSLIGHVIERHGGTVVDTTGDGVFAFWDSALPSGAGSAVLGLWAAAELAKRITTENSHRYAKGLPTRRVRIGLNSGKVALEHADPANGVPRLYGATVHEARRIEQAGKLVRAPGREVVIMASEATLQLAGYKRYVTEGQTAYLSPSLAQCAVGCLSLGEQEDAASLDCAAVPVDPLAIYGT